MANHLFILDKASLNKKYHRSLYLKHKEFQFFSPPEVLCLIKDKHKEFRICSFRPLLCLIKDKHKDFPEGTTALPNHSQFTLLTLFASESVPSKK